MAVKDVYKRQGFQHAAHEIGFVFAISVLLGEDNVGSVRNIAAAILQIHFYGDIAQALNVVADGAELIVIGL